MRLEPRGRKELFAALEGPLFHGCIASGMVSASLPHALLTTALAPRLWLRQDGQAAAVDGFEDFISAATQERGTGIVAESFGIVPVA